MKTRGTASPVPRVFSWRFRGKSGSVPRVPGGSRGGGGRLLLGVELPDAEEGDRGAGERIQREAEIGRLLRMLPEHHDIEQDGKDPVQNHQRRVFDIGKHRKQGGDDPDQRDAAVEEGVAAAGQEEHQKQDPFGEDRADPVFRMLYARTDSFVPAAFLQIPLQTEIYLDPPAAAKL